MSIPESSPLVSIIITVHNRTEFISEALDSVLAQAYKNYEIIVIDGGDPDNLSEVLTPYEMKIRYFYKKNRGLSAARNKGINEAKGKYLTFLDDDDVFEPLKLEKQVVILENEPDIGFIYSDYYIKESKKIIRNNNPKLFPSGWIAEYLFMNSFIATMTMLIRKKCFDEIGLFDETLKSNEDDDVRLRIAMKWKAQYSDYISGQYRQHSGMMSKDKIQLYESMLKTLRKNLLLNPGLEKTLGSKVRKRFSYLETRLAFEHYMKGNYKLAKEIIRRLISGSQVIGIKPWFYSILVLLGQTGSKLLSVFIKSNNNNSLK